MGDLGTVMSQSAEEAINLLRQLSSGTVFALVRSILLRH